MSKKPAKGARSSSEADKHLGQKIRVRRVEVGMSQQELGKALGVTFQQVQKYEKGVNRVSFVRLQQIATVLDVPMDFFQGRTTKEAREVDSLLALDSHFSVRLLRAYTAIKNQATRRQFVSLMEKVAGVSGGDD